MNLNLFKVNTMNKFSNFTMFGKRKTFADSEHDVCLTSAYMSFSKKAMKQLDSRLGDKLAVAAVIDEDDNDKAKVLLAPSIDESAYPLVSKPKVKTNSPLIFVHVGKKIPEVKGNYYLKRFGSHEGHEWWELTKEKPKKLLRF